MVTSNPENSRSPWLPVHDDGARREAVAPSKPAMPAAPVSSPRPEPIDSGEADIIAPVALPPQHEILPEAPSAPTAPSASREPSEAPAPEPARDPFSALGDSAVRSASLSASGAPTPLGGVPVVAAPVHDSSPTEGPLHEDVPGLERPPSPFMSDDEPAYAPRVGAGDDPANHTDADGEGDGTAGDPPASARAPWWRSVPALVVLGLLVMGGVAYGLYMALWPQDEVELTPAVIVAPPEVPALDPVTIEDPTDFQAALPTIVGTYAMTAFDDPAPAAIGLDVRAAEAALLTYDNGETPLTLLTVQHFDEEAAVAQFEALAADGTDREPVEAGGATAGDRATVPGEAGDTLVWRNHTVVFELTGPAEATEAFFSIFPW